MLSIVEFLYYFSLRWACVKVQIEAAENISELNEIVEVTSDALVVEELSISGEFHELSVVRSVTTSVFDYNQHF